MKQDFFRFSSPFRFKRNGLSNKKMLPKSLKDFPGWLGDSGWIFFLFAYQGRNLP